MTLPEIYYLHEIGGKKNNEDYIWPVPGTASPDDKIFIVCDGVGGAENGEIASKIVAQSVGTALLKAAAREIDTPFINQLLNEARQKLIDYARLHRLSTQMATTFSLLIFIDDKAFISWCGDSRVYHIRKGGILFRTEDHSLVNSLVKSGEITEEEARTHPKKNMLLRAVNAEETDTEAEGYWTEEVLGGDYFMLCTDGLLENITDRDIKFLLEQNDKGSIDLVQSIQKFCYDKTRDNYSMYLVKVKTEEKDPETETEGPEKTGRTMEKEGYETKDRAERNDHPERNDHLERINYAEAEDRPEKKSRPETEDRPKKRGLRWLILPLVLLLAGVAFVIKENYYTPKKVMNIVVPVNINKDSLDKADSMLHESIRHENPVADTLK